MARTNIRAFTLTEVLVVMAVLAVLWMLLISMIGESHRRANRASCANNLKQIGTALSLYENVYSTFPVDSSSPDPMRSLGMLYRDFVGNPRAFSCAGHLTVIPLTNTLTPGSKNPSAGNLTETLSGFGYDPGYGTPNIPHKSSDSLAVVCADILNGGSSANLRVSGNHKGIGINVLLCSGSVEWRDADRTGNISNNFSFVENGKTIQIADPDIYSANALAAPNLDSNVRP